ncbi:MAG: hypothetical protein Q7S40_11605 [Opitutaceae bacterium]|nr:hypothetical protein [Opitutaceae bacterium]
MRTFFARIGFNAPLVALAALGLAAASVAQTLNDAPNLWGVTQGNGLVVAVGEQGAIFLRNTAGGAWRKGFAGAPVWLLGVAYGNGKFVAVGVSGAVLTSADGVVWTAGYRRRGHALPFTFLSFSSHLPASPGGRLRRFPTCLLT